MSQNLFTQFRAVVRRIPRGKVATYGDVARAAGKPGYARQVAWALCGVRRASEAGCGIKIYRMQIQRAADRHGFVVASCLA